MLLGCGKNFFKKRLLDLPSLVRGKRFPQHDYEQNCNENHRANS